jgi:hypothetical protein
VLASFVRAGYEDVSQLRVVPCHHQLTSTNRSTYLFTVAELLLLPTSQSVTAMFPRGTASTEAETAESLTACCESLLVMECSPCAEV